MKILAIEREVPGISDQEFEPYIRQEAARVWELHQSGFFSEIYFRSDQTSAVIILECTDLKEAEAILQTLPLVKEGLITFEIIP